MQSTVLRVLPFIYGYPLGNIPRPYTSIMVVLAQPQNVPVGCPDESERETLGGSPRSLLDMCRHCHVALDARVHTFCNDLANMFRDKCGSWQSYISVTEGLVRGVTENHGHMCGTAPGVCFAGREAANHRRTTKSKWRVMAPLRQETLDGPSFMTRTCCSCHQWPCAAGGANEDTLATMRRGMTKSEEPLLIVRHEYFGSNKVTSIPVKPTRRRM